MATINKRSNRDYVRHLETIEKLLEEGGGGGGTPNAVKYTAQSLTSSQQQQARTNIGSASASELSQKQDTLVSGTNIKTLNNQSLLGSGNITIDDQSAVKYTEAQSLSNAQKATARGNIAAASLADINNTQYVKAAIRPEPSENTVGPIYLIGPDANDEYERYFTQESNGTYTWVALGSTEIHMDGYATDQDIEDVNDEISHLEAKVDGIKWIDESSTVGNLISYYILASHTQYEGLQIYSASDYYATSFVPVVAGTKIRISCVGLAAGGAQGLCFYDSSQAVIAGEGIVFANEGTVNNDLRELTVPSGAAYIRTCIARSVGTTVEFYVLQDTGSLEEKIEQNKEDIEVLQDKSAMVEDIDKRMMQIDLTAPLAVDWMQFVHSTNGMTSVDVLPVVSATQTAMTFSSTDAAKFANQSIVAVKFTDGAIKAVIVKAASGTTVEREDFETTDLTNAVSVQSVHDTVAGGNGQHLSPYGYIALAQWTKEQMELQQALRFDNWLCGLQFQKAKVSPGYQSSPEHDNIFDEDGNLVCTPIYHEFYAGGYTPNGNSLSQGFGVGENSNSFDGRYSVRKYGFTQGVQGGYVEFPFSIRGKGFVYIDAATASTQTGRCQVTIFVDGVAFNQFNLVNWQKRHTITGISAEKSISVRFTLLDQADTYVTINCIGFFKMYPGLELPQIGANTKVAFLGDSWTQFPGTAQALEDYASYNEIVERPDGTQGNGYGYLPKEFARITGAVVHNWGKSAMRTDNWGLPELDKLLDYTHYDFVFIEFFINDLNQGIQFDTWKANLRTMCDKCRRAGATPVVVMPCATNSNAQMFSLGNWNQSIQKGVYKDSNV